MDTTHRAANFLPEHCHPASHFPECRCRVAAQLRKAMACMTAFDSNSPAKSAITKPDWITLARDITRRCRDGLLARMNSVEVRRKSTSLAKEILSSRLCLTLTSRI